MRDPQRVPPAWLRGLPNAVTMLRIALVPLFVIVADAHSDEVAAMSRGRAFVLIVLLAIALSDVVDGWLARRFSLATPLGATLDAVADKLAQVTLLTYFALQDGPAYAHVPLWFAVLVITRDLVLGLGWLAIRARRGKVDSEHEPHGKLTSVAMFAMLIWVVLDGPQSVVDFGAIGLGVIVLISAGRYVSVGWRQYRM